MALSVQRGLCAALPVDRVPRVHLRKMITRLRAAALAAVPCVGEGYEVRGFHIRGLLPCPRVSLENSNHLDY
jgi:hypothetical protein